ncbi:TniQ family protein [Paenibacillus sp. Soil750]|uniref:TniQ family protein n=1 Tax=Paenibacillus sp. Soil750 TaxID=1736398 RepID=UPI0006F5BF0B|nr:TniQ family protein [Paenibacillus sp. Soil750]KRE73919.1 hypothetical protein ASL11_06265 [Paenibacillus sp. Soil750]
MDIYAKLELIDDNPHSKLVSELYSLQPIGLKTGYVESLTSYITRLAKAHCVRTGSMFSKIFFPYLNKDYMNNGGSGFYTSAHLINGLSNVANEFIEMISALTGINTIDQLTLLRFKSVIPTRGLYRPNKAWCPRCFDEMRHQEEMVFEPLLWSIRPVNVCLKHQINLLEKCNNCCSNIPMLDGRSKSGYCPKCSNWLGIEELDTSEGVASDWDVYRAKLIEELLSSQWGRFESADVTWTLSRLVDQFTGGNVSEYAKFVGVPKTTFWGWYSGKNLPTLDDALRICNKCDVTLVAFYSGSSLGKNGKFVIVNTRIKKENVFLTAKSIPEVGKDLEQVIMNRKNMRINVTQIAGELQCNKKTLYKYFRPICKLQTRMNKYYKAGLKGLRLTKLTGEVSRAFISLIDTGQIPTVRKIETKLNRPAILREMEVKKYYNFLKTKVD